MQTSIALLSTGLLSWNLSADVVLESLINETFTEPAEAVAAEKTGTASIVIYFTLYSGWRQRISEKDPPKRTTHHVGWGGEGGSSCQSQGEKMWGLSARLKPQQPAEQHSWRWIEIQYYSNVSPRNRPASQSGINNISILYSIYSSFSSFTSHAWHLCCLHIHRDCNISDSYISDWSYCFFIFKTSVTL